jgi:hypothetical protein
MHLLGVLSWDPQIRGALIVLLAFVILCGSVYLLLATNMGAKVGMLLAVAGLSGWLVLLNIIWLIGPLGTGPIGYKGSAATWVPKEIVEGNLLQHSGFGPVAGTPGKPKTQFPNGWKLLAPGSALDSSASPAADTALIPPAAGANPTSVFAPPFTTTQDYVDVAAYSKGGHNYLFNFFGYKVYWRIRNHPIYFKHQPTYVIIRVQPVVATTTLAGAATTLPAQDVTQPLYSVVLERNVGSLRLPPVYIGFASFIIFGLSIEYLHHRDKEIARLKAEGGPGPGRDAPAPTPAGELQPA